MDEMIVVARRTEALDVLRQMANGNTVEQACAYVGIDPRTFRKYLSDAKEAGNLFQELLSQSSREQIGIILGYRGRLLELMVQDALKPSTFTSDRIAVFNTIEKYLRQVVDEERIGAGDNEAAESVLNGPAFKPGISRFSITKTTQTTVTVESDNVPNSEQDGSVIDAEVIDPGNISELPAGESLQSNHSSEAE